MFARVDEWFADGVDFFELDSSFPDHSIEFHVEKLAYHNYQIWHYENWGRSHDDDLVVRGWRGAQENNKGRNLSINEIDAVIASDYRDGAEVHSETVGSIVDRITIQYLKFKNFGLQSEPTAAQLRRNIDALMACCESLLAAIAAGEKRCLELPRLKLYFFEEPAHG